ncbi:MAG: peptidoglycan DD-metalloendopeptidase family protein [Pyrinomonadaceae bacterium]|nr:peptidoglycan DD-metalloendopeptidase family protein [Pyrinomonadaceae bacterium]
MDIANAIVKGSNQPVDNRREDSRSAIFSLVRADENPLPPYVVAANGKAVQLNEGSNGYEFVQVKTSLPVFKSFGLSPDGKLLLYTSLENGIPTGKLYVEDLATGKHRRVSSRIVLEAAWSPANGDAVACTFSNGNSFGIELAELGSGNTKTLVSENVYAEILQWDDSGSGVHYLTSIGDDARLELKPAFISVETPEKRSVTIPRVPAGFPLLSKTTTPGKSFLFSQDSSQDSGAFRTMSPDGNYEITGDSLLGTSALYVRAKGSETGRALGTGTLLKVLPGGVMIRQLAPTGSKLIYVDWTGRSVSLTASAVTYNLPLTDSHVIQGGDGYSPPGSCSITSHSGTMSFAYDFESTVGAHALAAADGLVVLAVSNVTCNTIDTNCTDYSPTGCPGTFFGNVVVIQHADGTYTKYAHMETGSVQVEVGSNVCQGLYVGRQGHTGSTNGALNSCGDHLHFQRQSSPDIFGQAVAVDFSDVPSNPLSCGTNYVSSSTEVSHSISPSSQSFGIPGGSGSVNVTSTGCTWEAVSNDSWITITSAASGSGSGTVAYSVSDNSASGLRTGTVTIGGHVFTVSQTGGGITNQAPIVNAGNDQTAILPAAAVLNGAASDDGLPNPPAALISTWSLVSGPGTVSFGNVESLSTTATFSIAGIYTLRLTANDNVLQTSDDLVVAVNPSIATGLLSVSTSNPPANQSLTTEGTSDWSHWGLTTATSFNHKSGVAQQISNYSQIGATSILRYTNNANAYSWTDGTPTGSASTTTGVYTYGLGDGFQVTVPADITTRVLKLYVGVWAAQGKLEVTLSDGSASPYVDTSLVNSSGVSNLVYTLNYHAGSNGQTLTIRWTVLTNSNPLGNVTLQAATLATSRLTPPNEAPAINAGIDQTITFPATAALNGSGADDGLPTPPGALTTIWSQVSGPGMVAFANANSLSTTASFSIPGVYTLRLTGDDGSLLTTDDMIVTVNPSAVPGSLTVSSDNPPASQNLTTEGASDWAHWGLTTAASFNHKSSITQQISNYTNIGGGVVQRYSNNPNAYTWTAGTPTASATNTTTGLYVIGLNNGFEINVPADTTTRVLKLYLGLWAARGRLNATLSDGSAAAYVDTSIVNATATTNRVYTLNYQAGTSGQTLIVRWTITSTFNNWSNVTLQAATLATSGGPPPNQAPTVNAGSDQTITLPATASLNGTASDDGLPNPPAVLTPTWSKVSGPGTVTFTNANALSTTATFSAAGVYSLRLSANDSALVSDDDLLVTVNSNTAPSVNAGADQTITLPATASLNGTASDDGLPNPPGVLTPTWSKVSGPGIVTFTNANALSTTASFSIAGNYTLRLTANDSVLNTSDEMVVTVNVAQTNQAPTVNAGVDQTITLAATATLSGAASDDGLPNPPGVTTVTWSNASGPGTVTFGNANSLSTTASFSVAGVYTLRLTANDSVSSNSDDVIVTVNSAAAGLLSVTFASTPVSKNLSTEGTTDWAHWGLTTASSLNHKNGAVQQISNYTSIGSGTVQRYTNNTNSFSWTGGTPTASTNNTTTGIYIIGLGNGFQVTLPAETTTRVLRLYVGLWAAQGRLEVSLSDGSAPVYIDTSLINSTSTSNRFYTLNYRAGSAGQILTVKWTVAGTFNSWSNVTLQAATL